MSWLILFACAYSPCDEREPRITEWKILAHSWIQTLDILRTKRTRLSVALLVEKYIEDLKIDRVLSDCAIKIYLYRGPRVRCSKRIFFGVWHFINSLQSANFLISQTLKQQNDTNILWHENTRHFILQHLPHGSGNFKSKLM